MESSFNVLWLYDLPQWLFCLIVTTVFVGVALAGQVATRKLVRRWLGDRDYNDVVGQYLSAVGLLYGITLGLISVGAWENYGEVEGKVSQEAAAVATLYRSVDTYPEAKRAELTTLLREYTRQVIDVAWPEMRRGIVPAGGNPIITRFQRALAAFEPATVGQSAVHAEALRQFTHLVECRRLRLDSVTQQLPGILWVVVFAGSLLSLMLTWLLVLENRRLHDLLTALLASLLGLLIFLLATLDLPFQGHHSLEPDSFELVYQQLMKPQP
jgi:hypothetical protein